MIDARKSKDRDRIFVWCGGKKVLNKLKRGVFRTSSERKFLEDWIARNSPRTGVPGICENEVRARPERLNCEPKSQTSCTKKSVSSLLAGWDEDYECHTGKPTRSSHISSKFLIVLHMF